MELPKSRYTVTDDKHKYFVECAGKKIGPLISVTGALSVIDKPALVSWSARMAAEYFRNAIDGLSIEEIKLRLPAIENEAKSAHRKKSKDAADLGTACHAIFQAIMEGREPERIPFDIAEPAGDFKRWRDSSDIVLVASEVAVGSMLHFFGGRLDAVGYSKSRGGWGIVDFKTSGGFYGNEYSYQVGGYAIAFQEQYDTEVKWCEIVRFGKKEPFDSEARPVSDLNMAKRGFISALELSKYNKLPLIGEPTFSTKFLKENIKQSESAKQKVKEDIESGKCPF